MKYNPSIVAAYFRDCGIPEPTFEHRFDATRKWRFDLAWPGARVALEVEGGIWTGGRHSRGKGMAGDMEKYNAAAVLGWRVLRVQPRDLCLLETVAVIKQALAWGENVPVSGPEGVRSTGLVGNSGGDDNG